MKALKTQGYETPTPIQAEAIPSLIEGRDLVGIAQTGTGKTAAFVLPILHRLGGDPKPAPKRACKTLILAPTRELAAQIFESAKTYGHFMRPRTALVVGGVKPGPQVRSLEHGVDILVATPGRLLDHLGTGALRLTGVRTVVLDEADQMMDMGFIPAIRKIMEKVPKTRQTVLLSATMPKQIRALATDFLTDPAEVSVAPESQPIERIEQMAVHLPAQDKRAFLIEFLKETDVDRAIVFTRTKHGADRVMRSLEVPASSRPRSMATRPRPNASGLSGFSRRARRACLSQQTSPRGASISMMSPTSSTMNCRMYRRHMYTGSGARPVPDVKAWPSPCARPMNSAY